MKLFENVTREKLDEFRGKMNKYGVNVPDGDDVEIKAPLGVRVQATYDENAQTLTLRIVEKPVYVPESQIWSIVETGMVS